MSAATNAERTIIINATNMYMSNSDMFVKAETTINQMDPELLEAYQRVMKDNLNPDMKKIVSEVHEAMTKLNAESEPDKKRSLLNTVTSHLTKIKDAAETCHSLYKYGMLAWKAIEMFH